MNKHITDMKYALKLLGLNFRVDSHEEGRYGSCAGQLINTAGGTPWFPLVNTTMLCTIVYAFTRRWK